MVTTDDDQPYRAISALFEHFVLSCSSSQNGEPRWQIVIVLCSAGSLGCSGRLESMGRLRSVGQRTSCFLLGRQRILSGETGKVTKVGRRM